MSRCAPADVRLRRAILAIFTIALTMVVALAGPQSASAADNPYQRGPNPTAASVAATTGPFAIASVSVPRDRNSCPLTV